MPVLMIIFLTALVCFLIFLFVGFSISDKSWDVGFTEGKKVGISIGKMDKIQELAKIKRTRETFEADVLAIVKNKRFRR